MTDYTNGINSDSPQELERMTSRISEDGEIHDLIGVTVQKTVSQYHTLLRSGLEQEVERILQEFRGATADIEMIVTNRVKSRLQDMVRQEVQRIFDAALSSTNETLFGSIEKPLEVSKSEQSNASVQLPIEEPQQFEEETLPDHESAEDSDEQVYGGIDEDRQLVEETPPEDLSDEPLEPEEEAPLNENAPQMPEESYTRRDFVEEIEQPVESGPNNLNVQSTSEISETVEEPENIEDDELFEGTIRLNVEANDCIGEVVHFVRELRQKPQLRLLRMVGNNKDGVDIWLGLREPLHLKRMLPQIEGVSVVGRPVDEEDSSKERVLNVRLEPRPTTEEVASVSEA